MIKLSSVKDRTKNQSETMSEILISVISELLKPRTEILDLSISVLSINTL